MAALCAAIFRMTQIDPASAQSALFENVRKPKAAQKTVKSQEKGKSKRTEVSAPVSDPFYLHRYFNLS